MVPKFEPVRVVQCHSGPGTAETIYEDQYGRMWRERPFGNDGSTTGSRRGILRNGVIDPVLP